MTPAARLQASIEVLDTYLDGITAEQALTAWGRRSRYAGSKDRAAVRDHVFQALRCLRSYAAYGGSRTGRGLMIGMLRRQGIEPSDLFTGQGYAPALLEESERSFQPLDVSPNQEHDLPEWLWPLWERSLHTDAVAAAQALQLRAPVHLRVNLRKSSRDDAIAVLAEEGIQACAHPATAAALEVTEGTRKIRLSKAYENGIVELQDAASQAVISSLPLFDGQRVLDYCAGGGGKTLALAAQANIDLFAHDIKPLRMKDIAPRAQRAGVSVTTVVTEELEQQPDFDLVLCDAPCSGSGSWRRDPEGKWNLDQESLDQLCTVQADILDTAASLVAPNGVLAYATCSMFDVENTLQVEAFLTRMPDWVCVQKQAWYVHQGTDGFFVAVLKRK